MNKKIKRLATTTIICVLVASIFGSLMVFAPPPDVVLPPLIDVFVTNTSTNPIPVDVTDDTLAVTLDEPIDVTLDEPIDVTLDEPIDVTLDEPIDVTLDEPIEVTNPSSESLDVEVTNTDTNPIPVQDVDILERQPFVYQGSEYTVPAGKRLVIELYTTEAWGSVSPPSFYVPYIGAKTNGVYMEHFMSVTAHLYSVSSPSYLYTGTHQVRIYADPGTKVYLKAGFANVGYMDWSISGYLEDVS